ncbi:putative Chaperone J-domain superfamily [Helianthus annuus]|nr:putative Chaperone J-domain superfamily [Helianthus annuus]
MAGKYGIQASHSFKNRPPRPRSRRFYEGGFQQTMTWREAALILGVRESAALDKEIQIWRLNSMVVGTAS